MAVVMVMRTRVAVENVVDIILVAQRVLSSDATDEGISQREEVASAERVFVFGIRKQRPEGMHDCRGTGKQTLVRLRAEGVRCVPFDASCPRRIVSSGGSECGARRAQAGDIPAAREGGPADVGTCPAYQRRVTGRAASRT